MRELHFERALCNGRAGATPLDLRGVRDRRAPFIGVVRIVTRTPFAAGNPSGRALSGSPRTMRATPAKNLPLLVLLGAVAVAACGKDALAPVAVPAAAPVDLVIGEPAPPAAPKVAVVPRPAPAPPVTLEREADVELEPLPKAWAAPIVPTLGFGDALRKGRAARDAFERLAPPPPNAKEATLKAWFGQAQMLVDQASRMYAGAFHAKDATREGRIEAIAEAAELDMTMARTLDEQNLGSMPPAWRSDPAVAGTFEDVEVGPTRRWRSEARVLTRQCVDTARESNVATDAARRCAALRTGLPAKVARQTADAGAGCACSPGDPLCSASLGGWCGGSAP